MRVVTVFIIMFKHMDKLEYFDILNIILILVDLFQSLIIRAKYTDQ